MTPEQQQQLDLIAAGLAGDLVAKRALVALLEDLLDPDRAARVTEAGEARVTEDGQARILEAGLE